MKGLIGLLTFSVSTLSSFGCCRQNASGAVIVDVVVDVVVALGSDSSKTFHRLYFGRVYI